MDSFVNLRIIRTENQLTQEQWPFLPTSINKFFNTDVKTLNDAEHYSTDTMYLSGLLKDERDLIVKYRIMNDNGRAELMNTADKLIGNGEKTDG